MKNLHRLGRRIGMLAVMLGLWVGMAAEAMANPSLYVYLPTTMKARTLQTKLQDVLPAVTVTVFGRIGDLDRAMTEAKPDALLAFKPVLETRGYPVQLQGVKGDGDEAELYVMLGPAEVTPEQLTDKVVGALDLLGRKYMGEFVALLLGNQANPDVKRVRSTSDLLPLLQFGSADVAVLPEAAVKELKSSSQLDLKISRVETAKVGLAAVTFFDDADRPAIETAINGMSEDTRQQLGIDGWRAP